MEWKATVEAVLAKQRKRRGAPVSLDEIFILHEVAQGETELSREQRDLLLDRLSADPNAARKLLSLLRFPELANDSDTAEAIEVEERWRVFSARHLATGEIGKEIADRAGEDSAAVARHHDRGILARVWTPRPRFMPMATTFVLGALVSLAVSLLWYSVSGERPPEAAKTRINLMIVELLDDRSGITRSDDSIRLPASSEGIVVTLTPTRLEATGPFDLIVRDSSDEMLLRETGLEPGPGGVFILSLPRTALVDHLLYLQLSHEGEVVATFALEVSQLP